MADTKTSVCFAFHEMAVQFAEASVAAWPEDPLLPIVVAQIKGLAPETSVDLFMEHFGAHVDGLSKQDPEALYACAQVPAAVPLDLKSKYDGANENTRSTIWTYVGHLCRFTAMMKLYKHIPANILGAVHETARGLKDQLESGAVDPSSINPMELGQKVMSRFQPAEIEKMMNDMMKNTDLLNTVMAQMGSVLGPGGLAGAALPGGLASALPSSLASGLANGLPGGLDALFKRP